jgi:putative spermidine/putrescine transport system substrate-binding protein
MVSLMNQGGYDLVTASGDASLRLIYGKKVQPINTALIPAWNTIERGCRTRRGTRSTASITACRISGGANFLAYNTKIFPKAPTVVGRLRAADAAGRQEQQGPRAGL